jgi:hypothetical protein
MAPVGAQWTPGSFMLRLGAELVDAFRRLDTCKVSNAIETFDVRLRNEGFADSTIRGLFDDLPPPVMGDAATAPIRTAVPPPTGGLAVASMDIVCGDRHGVLTVPRDIAGRIPEAVDRMSRAERRVIQLCEAPDFSIDRLRALVKEIR